MIQVKTIVAVAIGGLVGIAAWRSSSSAVVGIGAFAFGTSVLVYFENAISDLLTEISDRMR